MDFLERKFTHGEEVFSSVTHGIGSALSIAGCSIIVTLSALKGSATDVAASSIYGASLILLFITSTLYHAIRNESAKKIFRILNVNMIFLLIAGTYTPIALCAVGGSLGWTIFGIIWAAAIGGIIFSSLSLGKYRKTLTVIYCIMGWAMLFAINPLYHCLPSSSLIMLIAGGIMYSSGIFFCAKKEIRYMHSIWHLFVLCGCILQYFSVLFAIIH